LSTWHATWTSGAPSKRAPIFQNRNRTSQRKFCEGTHEDMGGCQGWRQHHSDMSGIWKVYHGPGIEGRDGHFVVT
jgi:hypothetical protein